MSRSEPRADVNPCSRWFEWSGRGPARKGRPEGGAVEWYDKATDSRIREELPFTFLVLDSLSTITGYDEPAKKGIFANEVRDLSDPVYGVLKVRRLKGEPVATGLYADIKGDCAKSGGKFTKSVYLAYRDPETKALRLGNFKMVGTALSEWIEFERKHGSATIERKAVAIVGYEEKEKGDTDYRSPVFELREVSDATAAEAAALDAMVLQPYLRAYIARMGQAAGVSPNAEAPHASPDASTPFDPDAITPGRPSDDEPCPF